MFGNGGESITSSPSLLWHQNYFLNYTAKLIKKMKRMKINNKNGFWSIVQQVYWHQYVQSPVYRLGLGKKKKKHSQWLMKCCNTFALCFLYLLFHPMAVPACCWSPERVQLIAVICAMIGSKCITAQYSCCICLPRGSLENILPVSSTGCKLRNSPEDFCREFLQKISGAQSI